MKKRIFEPRHDKTNKISVRQAKTQIGMKKAWVLSYPLSAQRRLCSDWADAQADLSLRWAHSHFVGFVMSRLICGQGSCAIKRDVFMNRFKLQI